MAPSLPLLVAARALQGIGAAFLMTLSMALMRQTASEARIGRAMGLLGTVSAIGTALGPTLGGLLIPLTRVARRVLGAGAAGDPRPRPGDGVASRTSRARAAGASAHLWAVLDRTLRPIALRQCPGRRRHDGDAGGRALLSRPGARPETGCGGPRHGGRPGDLDRERRSLRTAGRSLGQRPGHRARPPSPRHGRPPDGHPARPSSASPGYLFAVFALTPGYQLFQAANNTAALADVPADRRGTVSGLLSLSRNIGLIAGASAMGAVFAFGVGTDDFARASASAIEAGLRLTFLLAAGMMFLALFLTFRTSDLTSGKKH